MSISNKKSNMNTAKDLFDITSKVQEEYDLRSVGEEEEKMKKQKNESSPYDASFRENSFKLIESYFKGQHLDRLVRHQLESYNNFVGYQIIKTIEMFNPLRVVSENDYDPIHKKHALEIIITFENFQLYRPQIHENNGAIKLMFPNEARLRNFTYASSMTIDMNIKYMIRSGKELENIQIIHKIIPKIHIGKLPIMLKSSICVLNQYKHVEHVHTGECKMDTGGYFIINGSEKIVLGQERAAENKVYVFNISKNNTKYVWLAEVKSIPDDKCISPKQINMMISSKNNGFGYPIYLQIPRVKQPISLFIVFRALGVLTDKEICEKILLDIHAPEEKELLEALHASIIDANKYLTQEECIRYITSFAMYTPINMDKETGARKKLEFTLDILNNDLFPHCRTKIQKIYYLGYMTKKILMTSFDKCKQDDRDSYLNKRIDLTGSLLNNLFRNYFNKLVKDMEKQIIREINNGSWRSKDDYENIINLTNIYKIVKSTTIENGLKRALATGDFGLKHTNSNKVGVAQVLNRLTYVSSLSHSRRISTPIDKSGKLIPPRKLHSTSWGFLCLTGDTDILSSNRMDSKKIKDIKDGDWVNTVHRKTLLDEPSDMSRFFCEMPDKLYEILTISGRKIKATADHPFLVRTKEGKYEMKKVSEIELGNDKVIIRHMVQSIMDENTTVVIIHDKDVLQHYRMDLLEKNLLNVEIPVYKLKIIARLLGALNTDGHLGSTKNEEKNKNYYSLSFSVGEEYDVYQLADDVKTLGFGNVSIRRKISKFEDKKTGRVSNSTTWEVSKSGVFAYFMYLMGGFPGKKTNSKKGLPEWLINAELSIKREFLSGFQGGDGSKLSYQKNAKTYKPNLGVTVQTTFNEYMNDTLKYMDQIVRMFKEFAIECRLNTYSVDENKSKVCIVFEKSTENLVQYANTIHYCYCEEKRRNSAPIIENLKIREYNKKQRDSQYQYIIENVQKETMDNLVEKTKLTENQIRKIVSKHKKGLLPTSRFTTDLIYENFIRENMVDNGCVSVPILSITEIEPEMVYDFTTRSENHSFVASSFVVSNCPAETPEGQSVGVVKNMSYMTHITIYSNPMFLYEYILPQIITLDTVSSENEIFKSEFFYSKVKVFINGSWVGISDDPETLYQSLKDKKSKGIINIYTSIIFDYRMKEIRICNDAGRLTRPLLRVKNGNILLTDDIANKLETGNLKWNDLLIGDTDDSLIEYIDAEEQSHSMITVHPNELINTNNDGKIYKYTHSEIHPSTIFGILSSCIPFPEHNQSPRVVYQCAQGKQAMGIYATNYYERMDKTAYILNYPTRPMVDTRIMDMIQINKIPSGTNVIVAIMTHTGYNQEDSLLFNKGSIDRGLFVTTIYHTEKDEDKQKINGDEEIRCKPERTKTKGMKMGNYDKVNSQGVIPENTLVENRDVIIAKIVPIKENKNDHTKLIKYEDQSKIYRTAEETFVDKNFIGKNGEGYNFAKVRLRTVRKPNIGDKFCALPTQQVLTDQGWIEIKDVDIHRHKLVTLDTNGKLCYEYPTAKYEYDHDDKMYSIKNKQIHIVCTLNHRLYVKKRSSKNYELIEAKDVMGKMVRFQKTMENTYPDLETITFGDMQYKMDDWIPLLGMFIADGSCDKKTKRITITVLKERKIEFVKNILTNLNIGYTYEKDGNFRIKGNDYKNVYEELLRLNLGSLNKHLPHYVWNLSQRQSILLLEALLEGDGSNMTYKGETFHRYGTISLQLANDITRLALHCGWSGIVKIAEEPNGFARIGKRNLGSRAGQEVSITQKHTYYKVSIITKQNQPWINKKQNETNEEKLIDYEGKVYCVEMPSSHTYYMRESEFSPCLIVGNSSRHGQKGTIGNIIPECDMPFTSSGIRPDIIINPHAIPSRMTIGQLKETALGKVLVQLGLFGDGTSFGELEVSDICEELLKVGYEAYGNELLYNGLTGEQHECSVFMGPVFYQRLKHMVNDKTHSRSIGPMVNLTRQPAEGRSRDGGLRFGEMERDCGRLGTPLSIYCGLSIKIENMEKHFYEVLGWSKEKNGIVKAKQSAFLYKGERECVDIILQDGRKISFTQEHPFLTSTNEWVKAKDLIPGETKLKVGVNYPVIDIEEEIKECKGWNLKVGELLLKTNTHDEYFKTLAFIRILGYLITDGNIHYHPDKNRLSAMIFLGHMLDVHSLLNDLKLFCSIKQSYFKTRNLYYVSIPNSFLRNIIKLDGVLFNKKVTQPGSLPEFLLEDICPRPIIREFLGGLFGGDGHTCSLGLHRGKRDTITSISFSQTKNYAQLASLIKMMKDIRNLLARCGIHKVSIQNPKETTLSKAKQHFEIDKNNYQVNLHLDLSELIPFSEKIGFRYCCHKSQRLEAGVSYRRLRNEVARQHNWLVNRVDELTNFKETKKEFPEKKVGTKKAILQAVEELKEKEGLLHEYAVPSTHDITDHLIKGTEFGKFTANGFPTAEEFFREIGALEWFFHEELLKVTLNEDLINDLQENELVESQKQNVMYGVSRECEAMPTMNLTVVSRIPVGPQPVYDIQVDDVHSFLANGIVAHNCMISHGASRFNKERLYDVSDKYSVYVCKKCGLIASYNDQMNIHLCRNCDNRTDFAYVEIPYACKLLFQELTTMNISPRIIT